MEQQNQKDLLSMAQLRAETIKTIMERDLATLESLKPSELLKVEDQVSAIDQTKKAGLEVGSVNKLWGMWMQSAEGIFAKMVMLQTKHGAQEIDEMFGSAVKNSESAAQSVAKSH